MNRNQTFPTLGVDYGTHGNENREDNDFYATDPSTIDSLLMFEEFNHNIWECACGNGVLSERLKKYGMQCN